jgi:hypothetical protein
MDDRQSFDEGNPKGSAKFPGGGLGVAATMLGALHSLNATRGLPFSTVMNNLERELGGMSFHSDHHNAHDPFPAAGCGHVNGILAASDAYGLGDYRELLHKYTDQLSTREDRHEKNITGYSYSGGHAAQAVIFVDDQAAGKYLSVPGLYNSGVDGQAFIINHTLNKCMLRDLARSMGRTFAPELRAMDISTHDLIKKMIATYEKQLMISLGKLAKGLDVYYAVSDKTGVRVDDPCIQIP